MLHKDYKAPSVFTADSLLREARRQKAIPEGSIPTICILDPDGDIVQYLVASGQAAPNPYWACYHTKLYTFSYEGAEYGIIPHVVGASFAVLVAEELAASGCELIISMTSAGQIVAEGDPPYFVLIERALRDEGTSQHYLPPSAYSAINPTLLPLFEPIFSTPRVRILRGATWTTDAPFRETAAAIRAAREEGILGVEMEAAALYAFGEARGLPIICFAHITNQMGQIEGDFEKGRDMGSHDALYVIHLAAQAWKSVHLPS